MLYDLIKSLHIVAVVVWFAGTLSAALALKYGSSDTLKGFRRFDQRVTTPALAIVWAAGFTMALWYGWLQSGWLMAKLPLVVLLSAVHGMLSGKLRRVVAQADGSSVIGDYTIPLMVVTLLAIVTLAVTKAF